MCHHYAHPQPFNRPAGAAWAARAAGAAGTPGAARATGAAGAARAAGAVNRKPLEIASPL